jgi:outer membrane protein assembly factor BamB
MTRSFPLSLWRIALVAACAAFLAVPSAADGPYADAARHILHETGAAKGYCLVFGSGDGGLAAALAGQSGLTIIGVDEDPAAVQAARTALHVADLYGKQVTLHQGSLDKLPYRDYAAALVVSQSILDDGNCTGSAAEMFRMVRPDGGMALLGQPPGCPNRLDRAELERWLSEGGVEYTITESADEGLWARVDRGPLPGAGEWTHMWADLGNTACSGDERTTDAFKVLWFGEPGPRIMVDRHWEPVAPLYKDGRMFVPGYDRIICSDAYNGARLWDLEVPRASRIAMMRDAGFLALDEDYLHVAVGDRCLQVDVGTGAVEHTLHPPTAGRDWGYVAVDGGLLLGSEQVPGASYLAARTGRGSEGNQLGRGDNRMLITSKALFCLDRSTGRLKWRYANEKAVIANPTICIGDGAVFFMESTDPGTVSDADGRVTMAGFTEGASEYLVKVDEKTGEVLWRRQWDMASRHVMHLSYAKGIVLASGCTTQSGNYWYHLRAFAAGDGSLAWERDLDSTFANSDTDHGKQDKHPVIVAGTVHLKQGNFDLATGEPRGLSFNTTNCADCSASMSHIFTRNNGVATVINLEEGGDGSPLCSTMRPGCYISIIPAGGIVMLPAFSAGCTCGHSIQTTIAWLPQ